MGDLLARFKDHLVTLGISDGSIRNYLSDLNHFQNWLSSSYPKQSFADINPEHPLAYRTYLVHELEAPVSSVNRRLSSLRQFFTWAVTQNLLPAHPMEGLSNISIRTGNTEVTPQQSQAVPVPLPTPVVESVSVAQPRKPRKFPVKAAAIALLTLIVLTLASLNAPNFLSGGVITEILTVFRAPSSETTLDPETTSLQEITQNKRLDTLDKSTQELSFEQQRLEQDQQSLQEFAINTQGEVENFDSTTENLIQNSSFELNSAGAPLKWQYFNFSSGSNTVVSQEAAHTGINVLKFSLDGIKYGGLTQSQSKTRSDSASALSVWVRGAGLSYNGLIKLGFKDDTGKYAAFQDFYLGGSFGWQRLTVSANAQGLYPAIEFRGYTLGTVYLDDWQLTGGRNQVKYAENKSSGQGSVETSGKAEVFPVLGGSGSLGTSLSRFGALYLSGATIDALGNVSIGGTTISRDIKPLSDRAYDLGNSSYYYRTIYAQSIIADGTTIAGDQTILGNLTVAGTSNLIGNVSAGSNLTVSGTTTLTGLLTSNGGIITNNANINTGTGAISGGSIAGATLTTTGNTSVGGALTVSSTINSNTFNATSLSFSGASPIITTSSPSSGISLEASGSGLINIGAVSTGDISIGGGSGSTGCTIFNSSGNLTCSGNILGAATGTVGYWTRAGTTLSPATSGDSVTTSGNISTTGSGTVTSAGLLTASNGLTLSSGALNITSTSGAISATGLGASTIGTTASNLTLSTTTSGTLSLTSAGALNLSAGAASTFTLANVTNAFNVDSNTLSIDALNNRVGIGTNAPDHLLSIVQTASDDQTVNVLTGSSTRFGAITLGRTATELQMGVAAGNGQFATSSVAGDIVITNKGGGRLLLGTGNAAAFAYIDTSGNLGIGDSSPSTRLALGGTGLSNGITLGDDAADSVNLYRSAANTLKTDDDLVIGATGNGKITVGVVDPYLITNTGTFQSYLEFRNTATAGADDFVFTLGGAERARLTEEGNLTVLGTLTTQSTSTSTFAGAIDMQNNVILNIGNSGTDFIATTGALNLAGVLTANGGITLGSSQTFSATSGIISATGLSSSTISTTSSNLTLSTATSGTLALTSAGALNLSAGAASTFTLANVSNALNFDADTLSIDALNNRVGIGTASPGFSLDIQKTSADASINVQTTTSGNAYLQLLTAGNQTYQLKADRTNNYLMLGQVSRGNDLIIAGSTGNVGIGTTAPGQKLEVYNGNLLRNITSETFTNQVSPGAPTVAIGSATGLTGTFNYQVTFVTASGETEGGTVSSNVTVSNQKIDLSAIPTGTSGVVTARKIYRSTAGPVTPRKLVTTISDNTTTIYTDSTADGSLGIQVPSYNTTASIKATGTQDLVLVHGSGRSLAIVDSSTNQLGKLSVNVIDPYLIVNSGDTQAYLEFRNTATSGADDFVFTLGGVEKARLAESGNLSVVGQVTAQGTGTNTFSGTVDMQNNLLLNIGNAGTDFTSTGGLNLAGVLALGSGPAASGSIRLSNNAQIVSRNAANTADISLAFVDGSNNANLNSGSVINFLVGGTAVAHIGSSYIDVGTTPATSGVIRIPNNTAIYARNAANTDNIVGIYVDSSNQINIGAGGGSTPALTIIGSSVAIGTTPATSGVLRIPQGLDITGRNVANTADISIVRIDSDSVVHLAPSSAGVAFGTGTSATTGVIRIPTGQWLRSRNAANSADVSLIASDSSDNVLVGNGQPVIMLGALSIGTTPATTGALRLPNNLGINFRNAANTADIQALAISSADNLQITSSSTLNISTAAGLATWTLQNVANAMNFDANTFSIDALNNRVGIGNAAPSYALDVNGIVRTVGGGLYATQASPLDTLIVDNTSSGSARIITNAAVNLALGTNSSTTQLVLRSGGNVGINTATPNEKLEVENGNILLDRSNLKLTPELPPGAPTVAVGTATGITGTFNYQVTFVTASGETEGGTVSANVTVSNQKVDLSAIPTGTAGFVTARKIYRSTTGPTTPRKLVTTINDNTTTIYTDTTTDASLGANLSNINTTASIQVTNAENLYLVPGTGKAVVFGDGTGKITAGTFDPVYKIDGINYSTYAPSMLGVKEEITGSVTLIYDPANNNYSYTIDLANQPQGSDLWVFSRISDPDVNMTSVLVSANFSSRVWYLKDVARRSITIFSDRGGEVSYRLTAPRFDYLSWGTLSEDQSTNGLTPPAEAPLGGESSSLSVNSYFGAFSENFNTTGTVTTGDLLSVDPTSSGKLTRSNVAYDAKLTGVATSDGPIATVTSAGRVQVRVSVENGNVTPGDHLTSSATKPGYAMKATQAGRTIGVALQPLTGSDGTILVSVNPGWFDPTAPIYNPNGTVSPTSSGSSATYDTLIATTANITNLNVGGVAIVTDESGNLKVNGNVFITGKGTFAEVRVNGLLTLIGSISVPNGLAVNLGLSKAFEIKNTNGEVAASISDQGALIARSAEVSELKVSTVSAQPTTGVTIFRAGGTSMLIETTKITSTSKVIVTFKGNYAPATRYWTSDEVSGQSFTLHLDQAPASDVSFNWWIIN